MKMSLMYLFIAIFFLCIFCIKVIYALSDVGRGQLMSYVNAGWALLSFVCFLATYWILRRREKDAQPKN